MMTALYSLFFLWLARQVACWQSSSSPFQQHGISTRRAVSSSTSSALHSMATDSSEFLTTVRQGVIEKGGNEDDWQKCVELITEVAALDSSEKGEMLLAQATNFKAWAMAGDLARKYQKTTIPDPTAMQAALTWLREGPLELDEQQIQQNVQNHPAVYLLQPDQSYKKALGSAPREYRDPEVFKSLVAQDPTVLQCYYNCDNDCASECGSCWVTYANRLA